MGQLLRLVIYVLIGVGLGWLVLWGCGELGLPNVLSMILAGIVFIVVLLYGLKQTGTADI